MLKGTKVNLRLARESDLEEYTRLTQDVDSRGEFFPLFLNSESTIRNQFREHGFWSEQFKTFLVVDPATDKMVGSISAFKPIFYQDSWELGYILHDVTRRGGGLMAEAVTLFSDYLFRWQNIFRIQLQIDTENVASRQTAEKAGFTHEGTIRQCIVIQGVPHDMEMYSLLRSELR